MSLKRKMKVGNVQENSLEIALKMEQITKINVLVTRNGGSFTIVSLTPQQKRKTTNLPDIYRNYSRDNFMIQFFDMSHLPQAKRIVSISLVRRSKQLCNDDGHTTSMEYLQLDIELAASNAVYLNRFVGLPAQCFSVK